MPMVSVDFSLYGEDRGSYYENTERVTVFLNNHESLDDIYKTIQHELVHHCLTKSDEIIDEGQEEKLIFAMAWADEYLA